MSKSFRANSNYPKAKSKEQQLLRAMKRSNERLSTLAASNSPLYRAEMVNRDAICHELHTLNKGVAI